jgi:hypothetical protein
MVTLFKFFDKVNTHIVKFQEKNTQFVDFFLKRLKSALNFNTDIELSAFLGVSEQAISNWKARNSANYYIVFTKCVSAGINLHWLFTGEGKMMISENNTLNNSNDMDCSKCPYKKDIERYQRDLARYEKMIDTLNKQIDSLTAPDEPLGKQKVA